MESQLAHSCILPSLTALWASIKQRYAKNTGKIEMGAGHRTAEFTWRNYMGDIKRNGAPGKRIKRKGPAPEQFVANNEDGILFFDYDGVSFNCENDIMIRLEVYNRFTARNHLLVNWENIIPI